MRSVLCGELLQRDQTTLMSGTCTC